MTYQVVLTRTDEGVSVCCPALPGCWSEGESEQQALANIRIAIAEFLAYLAEESAGKDVREVQVA